MIYIRTAVTTTITTSCTWLVCFVLIWPHGRVIYTVWLLLFALYCLLFIDSAQREERYAAYRWLTFYFAFRPFTPVYARRDGTYVYIGQAVRSGLAPDERVRNGHRR